MQVTGNRWRRAVGTLVALAALAASGAACSTSSDDGATTVGTDRKSGTNVTLATEGTPYRGGVLRYALGSETDGYNPTINRWTGDGTEVGLNIYDPLTAYAEDGSVQPYLAESFTPNDDFTRWTITLRPDITFHNGEPLDAAAVKKNIDLLRASILTGAALEPITAVDVTGPLEVALTSDSPWASLPVAFAGQAGAIAAPAQLDDPDGSLNPIGTGPFKFVSWIPDKELVTERNQSYWRTDDEGNQLPYLDGIVFQPITDDEQRVNAIQTGEVDMTWSSAAPAVRRFRSLAEEGSIQLVEQQGQTEVSFVMLNLAAPPFDDPTARQAIAHATDPVGYADIVAEGVTSPAYTLFRPGTPWYADIPIPGYDLEAAKADVEAYEAAHGPLAFSIRVLATPVGRGQGEYLQQQWQAAGMDVEIVEVEATQFLLGVVMGDYQSVMWAQFGSPDPDYEQVWWRSSSSAPVGEISLNFARHESAETDAALDAARATDDKAARKAAYDEVQRTFAEDLPYIYLDYSQPVVAASNQVRGITNGPLPDGQAAVPMGGPGSFSYVTRLVQTWIVPS